MPSMGSCHQTTDTDTDTDTDTNTHKHTDTDTQAQTQTYTLERTLMQSSYSLCIGHVHGGLDGDVESRAAAVLLVSIYWLRRPG